MTLEIYGHIFDGWVRVKMVFGVAGLSYEFSLKLHYVAESQPFLFHLPLFFLALKINLLKYGSQFKKSLKWKIGKMKNKRKNGESLRTIGGGINVTFSCYYVVRVDSQSIYVCFIAAFYMPLIISNTDEVSRIIRRK